MSKIQDKFKELKSKNEKALISYIMTGFPNENTTLSIVEGLVNGGADIIELGFPFSDPIADGPVIQNASTISLNKGAKIEKFFRIVKKIRKKTDIPLVLMTYTNVLYAQGYAKFMSKAKSAGIILFFNVVRASWCPNCIFGSRLIFNKNGIWKNN